MSTPFSIPPLHNIPRVECNRYIGSTLQRGRQFAGSLIVIPEVSGKLFIYHNIELKTVEVFSVPVYVYL